MLLNPDMDHMQTDMSQPNQASENLNDEAIEGRGLQQPDFSKMLVSIGKNKDKESFVSIFEHFAPRIKSFLIKGGASHEIADELAQETMLAVWRKASSYDPAKAAASTWIFTIARNKKIDQLRKQGNFEISTTDPAFVKSDAQPPDNEAIHSEEMRMIAQAIKSLPEVQSMLIKKSFFEGKTHAEISQETGIPLGTVKSRIRLALGKLRRTGKVKELWD